MRRSIKAAGYVELKDKPGLFFHPEMGAWGKLMKRSFRICFSRPRTRNGKPCANRGSRKPLEELYVITPGVGMAKLIRSLVKEAKTVTSGSVSPELLERMSDRLRCGSNLPANNRSGRLVTSLPTRKAFAGWSPATFRTDRFDD
jgi:hypothetical protein